MTRKLQTHDVPGRTVVEEEFVAAGGTETFTLAQVPRLDGSKLPGRDVRVRVNGISGRFKFTATQPNEWETPAILFAALDTDGVRILQSEGGSWSSETGPSLLNDATVHSSLDGGIFLVDKTNPDKMWERTAPGTWTDRGKPGNNNLMADGQLFVVSADEVWCPGVGIGSETVERWTLAGGFVGEVAPGAAYGARYILVLPSGIVLMGTGDRVYRRELDGTWNEVHAASAAPKRTLWTPDNGLTIYAGGFGTPVYKSRDEGLSWSANIGHGGGGQTYNFAGVSNDDYWSAGTNGVAHWDGTSWTFTTNATLGIPPATGNPKDIAIFKGKPYVFVGNAQEIYRYDGSDPWTLVENGTNITSDPTSPLHTHEFADQIKIPGLTANDVVNVKYGV